MSVVPRKPFSGKHCGQDSPEIIKHKTHVQGYYLQAEYEKIVLTVK